MTRPMSGVRKIRKRALARSHRARADARRKNPTPR
jgi:hypothetical protein